MPRRALLVLTIAMGVLFDARAQSGNGLPDQDTFFAGVRKRLASNTLLQSRFTFYERRSDLKLNPFGRMGNGPLELAEVYPLAEGMIYRRVIERDGVRLSPAELQQQDRQFMARYDVWRRELAREGQNEREARLKRAAAAREKDRAQAREALDLFNFTLVRTELQDGQPSVVVRFAPKPNAQPRSREGRVASSFAGYAWVHASEHEIMRLEAEAITDTGFGYGIIGKLHKGAKATLTRRKVGGVWLPSETQVTGMARALFRKVNFSYTRQYFNYRPFDPAEFPAVLDASAAHR